MEELYYRCHEALLLMLWQMEDDYKNNESSKVTKSLKKLLMTSNSKYEQKFREILKNYSLENEDVCKKIMLRIVIGNCYLFINYEYEKGINEEPILAELSDIEGNTATKIIESMLEDDDFALDIFEDFYSYETSTYILQYSSLLLIAESTNLKNYLKLNPFGIYEINKAGNGLTESELNIQKFIDLYDYAGQKVIACEGEEDEEELFYQEFLDVLNTSFPNEYDLTKFLSYIFSNIFEALSTIDIEAVEDYLWLKEYIKTTEAKDIINRFFEDKKFAIGVIDCFLECNDDLDSEELYNRRKVFKESGDVIKLQRLNPYYNNEEEVFIKYKKEFD